MRPLPCLLYRAAQLFSNSLALESNEGEQWNFLQWHQESVRWESALKKKWNWPAGSLVAIHLCSPPTPSLLFFLFAAWRLKWTLILLPRFFSPRFCRERLSDLPEVHWFSLEEERISFPSSSSSTSPFFGSNQPLTCLFTSGTTGMPKKALLSYGNYFYNALGFHLRFPLQRGDRWLLSLPLYHVGGLAILFRLLWGGGTLLLSRKLTLSLSTCIEREVTHLSLVHTQLYRMIQQIPLSLDPSGWHPKFLLLGGGIIAPSLLQRALTYRWPLYMSYGLTEMASQVSIQPITDSFAGELGDVLSYRQLSLSSEGEIAVRGQTLFLGYLEGEKITLPLHSGWFITGDHAKKREKQFIFIGRSNFLFMCGGEKIAPEVIERIFLSWKEVEQIIVVAVPDEEFDQVPAAFIQWHQDQKKTLNEIAEQFQDTLPNHFLPRYYFPYPQEENLTLKVSRREWGERAKRYLHKQKMH